MPTTRRLRRHYSASGAQLERCPRRCLVRNGLAFATSPEPAQSLAVSRPAFCRSHSTTATMTMPGTEAPDDQAYALEDYEEEAPAGRRRSGLVVVAAVLGLAVLGTAGAFAYRAMFGSSMLPSLPPIIKADGGPNKIVPNKPKSNASDQADATVRASGEKLVPREEQPVDVPAPANPAPRVVSTVPIFPDPNSGQAGVPSSAQGAAPASVGAAFPQRRSIGTRPPGASPYSRRLHRRRPFGRRLPALRLLPRRHGFGAGAPSSAPRKIHTVIIRTDQMGSTTADASAAPEAAPLTAPTPAPLRTAPARAAVQQARPAPAPRAEANGPLSIVPDQNGAAPAPAPRPRTALARPAETQFDRARRRRRRPRAAAMPCRSRPSAAKRTLRRSFGRCGPNIPASLAAASRSSGAPISAPKASITARWSVPLPRRTRRRRCARA